MLYYSLVKALDQRKEYVFCLKLVSAIFYHFFHQVIDLQEL